MEIEEREHTEKMTDHEGGARVVLFAWTRYAPDSSVEGYNEHFEVDGEIVTYPELCEMFSKNRVDGMIAKAVGRTE